MRHHVARSVCAGLLAAGLGSACQPDDSPSTIEGSSSTSPEATSASQADSAVTSGSSASADADSESGGAPTGSTSDTMTGSTTDDRPLVISGCEPVGTVDTDGVFSMLSFAGQLQIGQFGYGQAGSSMQYAYPPFAKVHPGLLGIGESVCAMAEFHGWLYANTENSGDILRSLDGQNWELVHNGDAGVIGCDLVVHDDHLYAVNYDFERQDRGRILRSADGTAWTATYNSGDGVSRYFREIASHNGELLAFSVDTQTSQGYVHRSADGTRWTESTTPTRFFRSQVWNGALWISSTERSSNGGSGIWQQQGDAFQLRYASTRPYVTELAVWRDTLFAATSDGWKDDVGTSTVLMSRDGDTWDQVCDDFAELAAWSLAVHDDRLFVGTWAFGGAGRVYEVVAQ